MHANPGCLLFLPPLLSLDMDLQVKHVEFDTRPCAMISAWCASPWQVSLADLTLNHGAWKTLFLEVSFCQFGLSIGALHSASVWFESESWAKGLREKHDLQARSRRKTTCAPIPACQLAYLVTRCHKPLSHTGQAQATLQKLTTVFSIHQYLNMCTIPGKPHPNVEVL